MRNWNIDTSKFAQNSREKIIWKLEQQINFGLKGDKISQSSLKKYFSILRLIRKKGNL